MKKKNKNRVAIITGASQGLGLEISKKFASSGMSLMICSRNYEELKKAKKEIFPYLVDDNEISINKCDVSIKENVEKVIFETKKKFGTINVLVNNAGIWGAKGEIEKVNWEEWVNTINTNLLGSVLMIRYVLPIFKANKYGKIIQLSGGGATKPMPLTSAYAASKAGIVRFVETISEEVRGSGIDINAIAPGALNTQMLTEMLKAGPKKIGEKAYANAIKQNSMGGDSLESAASLALFLASSISDGITGKLISAKWDNWKSFTKFTKELNDSDVFTLRRIVGKDREFDWGDK